MNICLWPLLNPSGIYTAVLRGSQQLLLTNDKMRRPLSSGAEMKFVRGLNRVTSRQSSLFRTGTVRCLA